MQFPRLLVVRQKFPDRRIADVAAEVRTTRRRGFAARLKPGARVAIGVGSRGIHNIATIVRNAVQLLEGRRACSPFIFPAMGSHGAASAAGQADVLAHYGITEATMGCPVVSQLEVVSLGKTADGIEAFMDKAAYESRRRDAGGPRQVAHRFRRQDRERPVQDDGDRARQIRRARSAITPTPTGSAWNT